MNLKSFSVIFETIFLRIFLCSFKPKYFVIIISLRKDKRHLYQTVNFVRSTMPPISELNSNDPRLFSSKMPIFYLWGQNDPKNNAFTVRRVYLWHWFYDFLATFLLFIFDILRNSSNLFRAQKYSAKNFRDNS